MPGDKVCGSVLGVVLRGSERGFYLLLLPLLDIEFRGAAMNIPSRSDRKCVAGIFMDFLSLRRRGSPQMLQPLHDAGYEVA